MKVVGPALTAEVDLERGAKITSLRDASGREWLAQAESGARVPAGRAFVDAEMAGWDECAPTIVACRVHDAEIPDHGDLWDTPFTPGREPGSAWAVGSSLRYRFQRTITPTSTGLRFDYEAEALDDPVPFLWAAHPQFAAPSGTRVVLDAGLRIIPVVDVLAPDLPMTEIDRVLSVIDELGSGECRKLYVRPDVHVQYAALRRPDGATLTMEWSTTAPYLGLWFDNCAYSHEPVIAIEPATGYFDSLATATGNGTAVMLEPGSPRRWWLTLHAH